MPQASLAQLAEHALRKRMVMGSIPIGGSFAQRRRPSFHYRFCCVPSMCRCVCVWSRLCVWVSVCVCVCVSVCLFALVFWSSCCLAAWSSGMIPGLGPRGPGFNSRSGPFDIDGVHCTCVLGWSVGLACRGCVCTCRGSIVVSISARHAEGPGSIPGRGVVLSSGDARWCVCVYVCWLCLCACLLCQLLWP